MIQRIQTIFLLLAAATDFSVLALPFASTDEALQASTLFSDKIFSIGDNIGLLVLFALAGALALAAIFLYNKRQLQIKIGQGALVADILATLLAATLFWQDHSNIGSASINGRVGGYLPLLFIVFTLLAIRGIKKDENLVRSADRLR